MTIYEYASYREYLAANYKRKRAKDSKVTMEVVAKHLGWSDFSYFSRILSGARKLPLKKVALVSKYFKLHGNESIYLENLVRWNDFNDSRSENICKSLQLKAQRKSVRNIQSQSESEFYEFVLIRMTIRRFGRALRLEEICKLLASEFSAKSIDNALKTMLEISLIREENGFYSVPPDFLRTENDRPNKGVPYFHKKMLYKAINSFEFPVEKRQFAARTVCVSESDLPELKSAIIEALDKIVDRFTSWKSLDKKLYQIGFHTFSLENIFPIQEEGLKDEKAIEAV
jgi:uncharacterized protein (TIGR02147 family)